MAQTSYSRELSAAAFAGQLGDSGPHRIDSYVNDEGSDIPAGILVTHKAEGTIDLVDSGTDKLAGAVLNTFARNPDGLTGTAAVTAGDTCNVLSEGAVWLLGEEAMAINDAVYVRHAAGTGTQLGAVRNDADSASCRQVKGARVLKASTGAGPVLVYLSVSVDTATL